MPWHQLAFPWAPPERRTLSAVSVRAALGYRDVDILLEQVGTTVRLSMQADSVDPDADPNATDSFTLSLDVGPAPHCAITETDDMNRHTYATAWTLTEAPDPQTGPFCPAATWALSRLLGHSHAQDLWRCPPAVLALEQMFAGVGQVAVPLCDPRARAVAMTFLPELRFWIYQQIVRRGERLAQAALACPGLLMLSWMLERAHRGPAPTHWLDAIDRGAPLRSIITDATAAWARTGLSPFATLHPRDFAVFIRRAPPTLPIHLLATGPAPGTELSDRPADAEQLAIWYEVVCLLVAHNQRPLSPADQRRLAGFVSRHAQVLWNHAERAQLPISVTLGELCDFVARAGARVPTRRRDPERVLAACRQWHLGGGHVPELSDEIELPRCHLPPPPEPDRAIQLTSVRQLRAESKAMHHCVASYAEDCLAGDLFVFRARFDGERLTVAVSEAVDGWRLREVAGKANRPPSVESAHHVRAWLANARA